MSTPLQFLEARRDDMYGWSRRVRVGEQEYHCSVKRGKSVRVPYHKKRGWQWQGSVYNSGRCIWSGRVPGSLGCRGLLIEAGVLSEP